MPKKKLTIEPPTEMDQVCALTDMEDEKQIVAQMQGEHIKKYVYSFSQRGGSKPVTGLSYLGISEAVRLSAKKGEIYDMGDPIVEEDDEYVSVRIKAIVSTFKEDNNGVPHKIPVGSRWGMAKCPKFMRRRDGSKSKDDFALQKASSKAQRNAISALLSEELKSSIIKQYTGEEHVQQLSEPDPITVNQVKRLHAIAGSHGIGHDDLTKEVKEKFGYNSTKEILKSDYEKVCTHVESLQKTSPDIPGSVLRGFEALGYTNAKANATWHASVKKYGDKAEEKCNEFLNAEADKEVA